MVRKVIRVSSLVPKAVRRRLVNTWIALRINKEKLFTEYYKNNSWKSEESRSGVGSTEEHTERLRSQLPKFFKDYNVLTLFDAPCGDFNWFRHVPRGGLKYIGADIVRPLVERNCNLYGDIDTKFMHFDIRRDSVPCADIWMCRDALFHFSNADIFLTLRNFVESDIPFILTTTFPDCVRNVDIPTGSFRLLNLETAPFDLEPPVYVIIDSVETWQRRLLGLWTQKQVAGALQRVNLKITSSV